MECGVQHDRDCSDCAAVSQCCIVMSPAAMSCSNPSEPSHSFERRLWSVIDGCGGGCEYSNSRELFVIQKRGI